MSILQTKQSVQGKQRHFFEQRRLLNRSDAYSSARRAGEAAASLPAKQRKGGSLDIISLTSLFIASKASKNGSTDEDPVGAEGSGVADSNLRLGTSSRERSTSHGRKSSKDQLLEKPLEETEGPLQKDYHGLLRGESPLEYSVIVSSPDTALSFAFTCSKMRVLREYSGDSTVSGCTKITDQSNCCYCCACRFAVETQQASRRT